MKKFIVFITLFLIALLHGHVEATSMDLANLLSSNGTVSVKREKQLVTEQSLTMTGVTLAKTNEHKETIKNGIAESLDVSSSYVDIVKVVKLSQSETKVTYSVKAANVADQTHLCNVMGGSSYEQKVQAKVSEATGVSASEMTVSTNTCEKKNIMVEEGKSTSDAENATETNNTKMAVDSTKDYPIVDHKGVNTIVTPNHVIDHNNATENNSTITLSECPKGEDGKICSDNGKCNVLSIGTEDITKTVVEKVCYCKPGYYGIACSKVRCNSPCGEHGVCKKDPAGLHPKCYCDKGWGGDGCADRICPHSDETSKIECSNHGLCKEVDGQKICYCEPNFYGDGCQFEYVQLPKPTRQHNITFDPLVPKTNVVDLDASNTNSTKDKNVTKSKLTGCRAVQFSETGERLESNVCGGHGICEAAASSSNPEASVYSCNCDDGYSGPLCTTKTCSSACAENGGTCNPVTGLCKNCPANRFGTNACESFYCGVSANDHLGNKCYGNGLCNNVTGKCTCFVDGEVDPKRCKDKSDTLCKPETCSFGKCVNSTHCKCDPGFAGKHCDKLICPEDCNWNDLRPQGECVYNAEGDMSGGKCQCYPGWKGDACDKQEALYEAGSACDQDCSNQCLDDFPSRCKISFDYFTTIWDKKSKTTVAKQVPATTSKMRPTLEQLHINGNNWTRSWKSSQGPESNNVKNARVCFLGCVTECLSSCQKELQLKSAEDRINTKKNTLVKDQLEMSGHISKDNLVDAAKEDAARKDGSEVVLTNKMVQDHNNDLSDQAEHESQESTTSATGTAGDLDGNNADSKKMKVTKLKGNKALQFKAVGEQLENKNKVTSSSNGILGWFGSLFSSKK
jgi:hypothetical protein